MAYNEERNPFFNVSREKLTTDSGIELDKEALVNSETGDVLGIVSPSYELVTNEEVADIFAEAIDTFKVESVQDHMDAETKRWKRRVIFNDEKLIADVGNGDLTGVMLEIYNGYNGKTAIGFNMFGYRYFCSNGQVMGKKDLFSEAYAHFVDNPEKLRDSFSMKFDAFHKNAEIWKDWAKKPMNKGEFESFVEKHTKPDTGKVQKTQYLGKKVAQAIVDEFHPTLTLQNLPETKWGAFNVLTYLATHVTKARKGSNVFSARYNTMNRLAGDFYGKDELALVVA